MDLVRARANTFGIGDIALVDGRGRFVEYLMRLPPR